jgi:hypothetical protein
LREAADERSAAEQEAARLEAEAQTAKATASALEAINEEKTS